MNWRWTSKRVRIASGCVLLATVGVFIFILVKDPGEVVRWTSILSFFVALIGLLLSVRPRVSQDPGRGHAERLDQAAEDLAWAVEQQWRVEERLRRVQDPFPLPLRWTAADVAVTDHWASVWQSAVGPDVVQLSGQLDHVVEVFDRHRQLGHLPRD